MTYMAVRRCGQNMSREFVVSFVGVFLFFYRSRLTFLECAFAINVFGVLVSLVCRSIFVFLGLFGHIWRYAGAFKMCQMRPTNTHKRPAKDTYLPLCLPVGLSLRHAYRYIHTYIHIYIYIYTHIYLYLYLFV